ncbi:MAG: hypothetical protein LBH12_05855 [Dysgonamonadaceae bacterium]|nr:hypothetical protein [Dysgonamonadaceae bacterium]
MKLKVFLLTLTLVMISAASAKAQVTIGVREEPNEGALLDLKEGLNVGNTTSTKGLGLPRVSLTRSDKLYPMLPLEYDAAENDRHIGLVVYNANYGPQGAYVWNGTKWVSLNTGEVPRVPGTGSFAGKRCFDIASGNDGIYGCGTLALRENYSQKVDFSEQADREQVYTFKPSGTVSNVYFIYFDSSGQAIERIEPGGDYSGTVTAGTPCDVTVYYKPTLQTKLQDVERKQALKPELYVAYHDEADNSDKYLKLTVNLQDCACCGAPTDSGGWLTFMCHNLGADDQLDPFTWQTNGNTVDNDIKGALYQWGRVSDGHQYRASATVSGAVSVFDGNGQPTGNAEGKFILTNSAPNNWRDPLKNDLWGDGNTTDNENVPKSANDPCPAGWKVPSRKQWASIPNSSFVYDSSNSNSTYGCTIGDALYLPAGGFRNYNAGGLTFNGCHYWSSTITGSSAYIMSIKDATPNKNNPDERAFGNAVRCVAE